MARKRKLSARASGKMWRKTSNKTHKYNKRMSGSRGGRRM